jgi:hypothetical protein
MGRAQLWTRVLRTLHVLLYLLHNAMASGGIERAPSISRSCDLMALQPPTKSNC